MEGSCGEIRAGRGKDERVGERGADIREILSGDEQEIAVAIISSWSGDGGPAM